MYDALASLDVPPEKVRVVVQSMERDLALFATQSQFSALDQQSAGRFDLLRAEIAASRERMAHIDRQFDHVQQRFEDMDQRFEQIDRRFEQMDQRFEQAGQARRQLEHDLRAYVDARFEGMETRLKTMQQQIEQRLTIRLGAFMVVAVATTATLVTLLHG
jgi:septal ring factor EnvC (AmiA/AmiB activator)